MKLAGWLSIVVAAILFITVLLGVRNDALNAASPGGRDLSKVDSSNTAWMVESISGAVFVIAGIALIASGSKKSDE